MKGLIDTLLGAADDAPLFVSAGKTITAGQVRRRAASVAARMAGAGERVYLHTASAANFVAGLLAAGSLGKTVALPAHTQAAYLAEIGCADPALVTDQQFAEGIDAIVDAAADPLLVFFTSGSTGAPKPLDRNLSRIEIEARALDDLWGAEAAQVIATVSHQHIYGMIFRVAWPVMSGRLSDDMAATYWEELEGRFAGATLVSSPAHLTRLPPRADMFAPPPAQIFSSGQLLAFDAAQACIAAFGKPVAEVLGSTETGGIAWRKQINRDEPWTPFASVRVTRAEDGALEVRSPYLQTKAPQHTGDGLEFLDDGRFRLTPRGDRVVKIDGKRVSLTRVEAGLAALPEVDAAAALTLPERKDALAAVVTLAAEGRTLLREKGAFRLSRHLRQAASASLEPAERPKHWRFVEAIPTNSEGKRVLSTLRGLFMTTDPLAPLDLDIRNKTDTEAEIVFTLPDDLIFFKGHFPTRAILPGVAQVHMATLIANKLWGTWPPDSNLNRMKFKRVLTTQERVTLKLKRDKNGRLAFSYELGPQEISSGEIGVG